ncbi:MAG: phosphoglycerate mutase family protein [Candidatus Gracilibacteria bacterium]|nr:phosphoglycerate mutase family protein [Candidatus Gracilibacteria bacterium]
MAKKILLIRHAESESNAGLHTSDPALISLTSMGYKQAENIAVNLSEPPELIVVSPYFRTQQTAEPTIKRFLGVTCEEWNTHEFTYFSPEKCKNTTRDERLPIIKKYWDLCDPSYCDGPGAESFGDFINRVKATINKIQERKEQSIVLFSHGQFIAALLWLVNNKISEVTSEKMREYYCWLQKKLLPNAGIVEVVF